MRYQKSRNGEIPNFTAIFSLYEEPIKPDIRIDTTNYSIEEATDHIMNEIMKYL